MVDGGVLQAAVLWTAEGEFTNSSSLTICLGERVKPFALGRFAEWLGEGLFIFWYRGTSGAGDGAVSGSSV